VNVLLIEDNPDDSLLLERHLRRNGFAVEVTRVETSVEMLASLDLSQPDIVLADYNLPNFSGPAALKILKASGIDVPFIMLSGAVSEESAVESMRAGAQDYVTKQNLARLVPAIERELREVGARRDRRLAESALRASEARFHRLVEAMPIGLLISDSTGRIVYANAAVERMLGYSALASENSQGSPALEPGEPAAKLVLKAICPALATVAERAFANLAPPPGDDRREGPANAEAFESTCITSAGANLEVLIGTALLNPSARPEDQQLAAFIADLTLQKRSEEILRRTEKLAVAGRLAASIAHEINNPLEAITNCMFLVGQTELKEDARAYLAMAQNELDRVSQITMQTLRFYRQSTRATNTDIQDLIGTVLTLLEQRMMRHGLAVERRFRATPTILIRDGEIRQVIANLIGNAIDALPEGGRLAVRTACSWDWRTGRPGIRITVADNGVGMSEETQSRIFEAFFSTKGITGTGLGLWISREIMEKHEGHFRVRSLLGRGTVFTMFLPREGSEAAVEAAPYLA